MLVSRSAAKVRYGAPMDMKANQDLSPTERLARIIGRRGRHGGRASHSAAHNLHLALDSSLVATWA